MRRMLAFIAVTTILLGCAFGEIAADHGQPVDLKPEDVIGTWRSGPDPNPRLITFRPDGTFAAKDLPILDTASDSVDFGYGRGSWEITASSHKRSGLDLHFRQLGRGEGTRLVDSIAALRQDNGEISLIHFDYGSGAGHTTYKKCAGSACAPVEDQV